jgi:single-strand DNA-binding protein
MASFNKVILMGNLTRDVELKAIGSGQSVAKISLAVNRNFTTASGEKREEVTYVECESWGKQAEVMAKYLSKGRPVLVEGRLKLDSWQDKEGNKRSALKVVEEAFQIVGAPGGGGGGSQWSRGNANDGGDQGFQEPASSGPAGDDIPF